MTTTDLRTTSFNTMQALSMRLVTEAESMAALVARLKLDAAGEPGDPEVTAQLDRVVDLLGNEVDRTWPAPIELTAGRRR